MARADTRVLRNDRDGVTWKVTPIGGTLHVEMVFDDEPGEIVARKVVPPSGQRDAALEQMIAEQIADGLVLQPRWAPTAAWIRDAEPAELGGEVIDGWVLTLHADPSLFERMPSSVRSFLALDSMFQTCRRSGLSSFLTEQEPQLIRHLPVAAREMGREEVAELWAAATSGMDLVALERQGARRLKFGSAKAARRLEELALDIDDGGRLPAWIREHAEEFASLAALTA
jgi:hypothetical protein